MSLEDITVQKQKRRGDRKKEADNKVKSKTNWK